jgi:hypothetical protein
VSEPVISGGRVLAQCAQCGAWVQLNKLFGGLHFCISDCEKAGRHLGPVTERKRGLLRRKWLKCQACGREERA